LGGDPELTTTAREAFEDPGSDVFLSAVSSWEIATKHRLGRLPLPAAPDRLVPRLRRDHGIEALDLDEESALHEGRLPALHRDPFDRLLIAQAIVHGLTILTPDRLVRQYPIRTVW
jgi:PIN domain nuclease of toxin-antitoxin system